MIKNRFIKQLFSSFLDMTPILAVVLIFQVLIIRQPIPDATQMVFGTLLVVLGLTLFIQGLEQSLFPIGESMAHAFARKGSLFWLLSFAFCLGFSATIAEPTLVVVTKEAAIIASKGNIIEDTVAAKERYALGLHLTIALAVGSAILIGMIRIIRGWPVYYLMIGGFCCVMALTPFAPANILGIAFDSGGFTTSTITVPLVTALGVGLATAIKGRNPVTDGFGLAAFASLMAVIFVLIYGIIW
ncbi:MAG: DUF1538 domain-containing protein [Methylovulum sp.]|nr:DUF1538 domain-containing protein [Methylovulum sp.]